MWSFLRKYSSKTRTKIKKEGSKKQALGEGKSSEDMGAAAWGPPGQEVRLSRGPGRPVSRQRRLGAWVSVHGSLHGSVKQKLLQMFPTEGVEMRELL